MNVYYLNRNINKDDCVCFNIQTQLLSQGRRYVVVFRQLEDKRWSIKKKAAIILIMAMALLIYGYFLTQNLISIYARCIGILVRKHFLVVFLKYVFGDITGDAVHNESSLKIMVNLLDGIRRNDLLLYDYYLTLYSHVGAIIEFL